MPRKNKPALQHLNPYVKLLEEIIARAMKQVLEAEVLAFDYEAVEKRILSPYIIPGPFTKGDGND
jgi:hypothetical protein